MIIRNPFFAEDFAHQFQAIEQAHAEALNLNACFDAMTDDALDMNFTFTAAAMEDEAEAHGWPIDPHFWEAAMNKASAYLHTFYDQDFGECVLEDAFLDHYDGR